MFRPRNTLVTVKLRKKTEEHVGSIVLPNGNGLYTEAEIVSVGPGCVAAQGGISETADLHPGQIVYVQYRRPARPGVVEDVGVTIRDDGVEIVVMEQTQIIAIVKDAPGPELKLCCDVNPHSDLPASAQLDGHNA